MVLSESKSISFHILIYLLSHLLVFLDQLSYPHSSTVYFHFTLKYHWIVSVTIRGFNSLCISL